MNTLIRTLSAAGLVMAATAALPALAADTQSCVGHGTANGKPGVEVWNSCDSPVLVRVIDSEGGSTFVGFLKTGMSKPVDGVKGTVAKVAVCDASEWLMNACTL